MAFASAVTSQSTVGNKRLIWGTWTSNSTTGGDVATTLNNCEMFIPIPIGSAVKTNAMVVNKTLPVAGGAITIVTDSGVDGVWIALGT